MSNYKPEEIIKFLNESVGCQFEACESSNILAYAYKVSEKSLWVVFKNNRVYRYEDVPQSKFLELQAAESKGKWVNANLVKPQVKCEGYEII